MFVVVVALSRPNIDYWTELCRARSDVFLYANRYDDTHAEDLECERALTFRIAGGKALFWKRAFTGRTLDRARHVWLMDEDVRHCDGSFEAARAMRAAIVQPMVVPLNHGKFQVHPKDGCVVHTTSFVEVQAPLFSADAWMDFHREVIRPIADDVLRACDWLDAFWCAFVEQRLNGSCAFARHVVVKHLDHRTLRRRRRPTPMPFHKLPRHVRRYTRFPSHAEPRARCLDANHSDSLVFH